MKYKEFLPQNLMPYGAPSLRRNAWKQQLQAFAITFGSSLLIGLITFCYDSGERNQIFPISEPKEQVKEQISMIEVKFEEFIQTAGTAGKLGSGESIPRLVKVVSSVPSIDILVPNDMLDLEPNFNELLNTINELFEDEFPVELTGDGGVLEGTSGGEGRGSGSGSWSAEGNGNGMLGNPEQIDETKYIDYDRFPEVDLNSLRQSVIYPAIAKRAGIEGRVLVRVLVDMDGSIIESEVIKGEEIFHDSALRAVANAKFTPAIYNGRLAPAWMRIPIVYNLNR